MTEPSCTFLVEKSVSRTTAYMKSSVTRTLLLAFWRQIAAGAAAPLEEHAFGLGQSENGVERIFYRVDEAGGALRLGVSGNAELDLLGLRIPVPVASVGTGLDAVAAHVEPDGRIKGGVLT